MIIVDAVDNKMPYEDVFKGFMNVVKRLDVKESQHLLWAHP
jgi:hypothetical protein